MRTRRIPIALLAFVLAATMRPAFGDIPPEALEALDAFASETVEKDYAIGAELLVVKDRDVVLHRAYGLADREDDRAWEIGTVCNIRSMTKPLTGAALQVLVDRGLVDLDAPVATYLEGFDTDASRAITVRQVITHRGGLPLTVITEAIDQFPDLLTQANAVGEGGPEFEPDSKFWYSDAGTDVIGAVVAAVAGEPLDAFVTRELLEPLGMQDTFYGIDDDDPRFERVASLYLGTANAWTKFWSVDDGALYPFAWGSQTLYSTPLDYAKFLAMWMDGGLVGDRRVLSAEAVTRQLEPVSPMSMLGSDQRFPCDYRGLEVYYGQMSVLHVPEGRPSEGAEIVGHSGSDGTIAWAWPERDLMVLFFTQSRGGTSVLRLEEVVDTHLLHGGVPPAAVEVPEALRPYVGTYIANFGSFELERFTVEARDGALVLDIPSQMAFELLEPRESDGFRPFALAPDQVAVEFVTNDDGAVDLLRLHQGGAVFDVPREGTALADELAREPDVSAEMMTPLVGAYDDRENDRVLEILIDDEGRLCLKAPPNMVLPLRLTPGGERWQIRQSPNVMLSFQRDDDGAVVSMTRHIGDETRVWPRRAEEGGSGDS